MKNTSRDWIQASADEVRDDRDEAADAGRGAVDAGEVAWRRRAICASAVGSVP